MNFRVVPKAGIDTGIESVREILKSCVFDEEKCAVGIPPRRLPQGVGRSPTRLLER